MAEEFTPTSLSAATGISVPYASQILGGSRRPSRALAIRIYRKTGKKFPPIENATDDDIDTLERFDGEAA